MGNTRKQDLAILLYIAALFGLNLFQSASMDLSHDEAYYWFYSLFPAWGYYDHPPMAGWMIWAGSLLGKSELAVRLPFVLMNAGTLWVLWLLARRENALVFVATSLSFPLLLAEGFLALPDTPLVFFASLFWLLARDYRKEEKPWHLWALPLVLALMFYSKYHAVVVAALTYAAMPEIAWRKSFWTILALAAVLYFPHLHWQFNHDFVSLDFHLNKRSGRGFAWANVFDYAAGQLLLGGVFAFVFGLRAAFRKGLRHKVMLFNSFGLFAFVFLLSFRNKIEANWTATAFAALVPYLAVSIRGPRSKKRLALLCLPSILLCLALRGVLALPFSAGEYPFARLAEVKNWRIKTRKIMERAQGHPVFAETYQLASKLSFYGNELVWALELEGRKSQFSLLRPESKFKKNDKISYVSPAPKAGGVEVNTGHKGPVFVLPGIELWRLLGSKKKDFAQDYEEAVRN